jgi:hypothetical protein
MDYKHVYLKRFLEKKYTPSSVIVANPHDIDEKFLRSVIAQKYGAARDGAKDLLYGMLDKYEHNKALYADYLKYINGEIDKIVSDIESRDIGKIDIDELKVKSVSRDILSKSFYPIEISILDDAHKPTRFSYHEDGTLEPL